MSVDFYIPAYKLIWLPSAIKNRICAILDAESLGLIGKALLSICVEVDCWTNVKDVNRPSLATVSFCYADSASPTRQRIFSLSRLASQCVPARQQQTTAAAHWHTAAHLSAASPQHCGEKLSHGGRRKRRAATIDRSTTYMPLYTAA